MLLIWILWEIMDGSPVVTKHTQPSHLELHCKFENQKGLDGNKLKLRRFSKSIVLYYRVLDFMWIWLIHVNCYKYLLLSVQIHFQICLLNVIFIPTYTNEVALLCVGKMPFKQHLYNKLGTTIFLLILNIQTSDISNLYAWMKNLGFFLYEF